MITTINQFRKINENSRSKESRILSKKTYNSFKNLADRLFFDEDTTGFTGFDEDTYFSSFIDSEQNIVLGVLSDEEQIVISVSNKGDLDNELFELSFTMPLQREDIQKLTKAIRDARLIDTNEK